MDGTFLETSDSQKDKLYKFLHENPHFTLIFVTGRNSEIIMPILDDVFIPNPTYIISDVGATVLHGDTFDPVQPIQNEISKRWYETLDDIKDIKGFENLTRQPIPQERRMSYFASPEKLPNDLIATLKTKKCNVIYSNNMYLDIMPHNTSKGETLKALINHLGIEQDNVMVAGDTLNDLSLYQAGFKGVVLDNAEEGLKKETQTLENCFISKHRGTDAIFEALQEFKMIPPQSPIIPFDSYGPSNLVMVYHRLPFKNVKEDGEIVKKYTPNGVLSTMLNFFRDGEEGTWIAWTPEDEFIEAQTDDDTYVDRENFENLRMKQIPLGAKEIKGFYDSVSRGALWPLIHLFYEHSEFNHDDWEHYKDVNRIFAEEISKEAAKDAIVWLHDYTLWLVPGYLRALRPDVKIAFFHHTYFPPPDVFNLVPWKREIIGSMLECDYIGFHIPHFVDNFVDVIKSNYNVSINSEESAAPRFKTYGCAIGTDRYATSLNTETRTVHLGAHPVGINCEHINELAKSEKTDELAEKIKKEVGAEKLIISVERTDYTKGPIEKLKAFKKFFEKHPDMLEKVSLVMVCTPASQSNENYQKLTQDIAYYVGLINGKFGTYNWLPIRFFSRAIPFDEVIAYYKAADIAWVTPLRDGLNLVAKEYVMTKHSTDTIGALVLSEFAGAAVELHSPFLTNPYDVIDMSETLYKAINTPDNEKISRIKRMANIIIKYDVNAWGEDFLNNVRTRPTGHKKHSIVENDSRLMKETAA